MKTNRVNKTNFIPQSLPFSFPKNNFLVRIDGISGSSVFPFLSLLLRSRPAEIPRGLPYKNDGAVRRTRC